MRQKKLAFYKCFLLFNKGLTFYKKKKKKTSERFIILAFKYKLVEQKLTSVEAQSYCEENFNRGQLIMDGIDTMAQRRYHIRFLFLFKV